MKKKNDVIDDYEIIAYRNGLYEIIDKTTGIMVLARKDDTIKVLDWMIENIRKRKK